MSMQNLTARHEMFRILWTVSIVGGEGYEAGGVIFRLSQGRTDASLRSTVKQQG